VDKFSLVNRSIFFYVFSFPLTNIMKEISTNHVSIVIANLSIAVWNGFISTFDVIYVQIVD
jgi:hypothetical protein